MPVSRRDVLLGTGAALVQRRSRAAARFDLESFVADCRRASADGVDPQKAVQDIMARAMSNPEAVLEAVGEPQKGGIRTLFRSVELTVLDIVWSPLMQLLPHEHRMWSVIGIYTGREDNIFWQRQDDRLAAVRATALARGNVVALPYDVIHSVNNPIERLTGAIHIYGGDFFAKPRSEWDPETLAERAWNVAAAVKTFEQSNERFLGWKQHDACRSPEAKP